MKRILVKLVVFLLLGAIINVAVAIGCAAVHTDMLMALPNISDDVGTRTTTVNQDMHQGWRVWRQTEIGSQMTFSMWYLVVPPSADYPRVSDPDPASPDAMIPDWAPELTPMHDPLASSGNAYIFAREDGWPCYALGGTNGAYRALHSASRISSASFEFGDPLPTFRNIGPLRRFLPLRPLWPGFAINTLFYAVILWVAFIAPFALRRRRRMRRGLCPACAYPVGMSAVCTECGRQVTPRASEAST